MSECLRLTDKNFEKEVIESKLPVFVDFWGSWCPPCKMIEPIIDQLAQEFHGIVKVGKLNVDQNSEVRSMFNIVAAPTFILFKERKILQRVIGARSKKQLMRIMQAALVSGKPKRPLVTVTGKELSSDRSPSVPEEI